MCKWMGCKHAWGAAHDRATPDRHCTRPLITAGRTTTQPHRAHTNTHTRHPPTPNCVPFFVASASRVHQQTFDYACFYLLRRRVLNIYGLDPLLCTAIFIIKNYDPACIALSCQFRYRLKYSQKLVTQSSTFAGLPRTHTHTLLLPLASFDTHTHTHTHTYTHHITPPPRSPLKNHDQSWRTVAGRPQWSLTVYTLAYFPPPFHHPGYSSRFAVAVDPITSTSWNEQCVFRKPHPKYHQLSSSCLGKPTCLPPCISTLSLYSLTFTNPPSALMTPTMDH